jgi:flagellar export protein FliJ
MSRDPLAPLKRLRTLQVATARRDLADRRARAEVAAQQAEAAQATLLNELAGAPLFADSLAAWLPVARAARDRATGDAALAEQAVEVARGALAEERSRARVVELLIERRAAEARAEAARRAQAAIDEVAQRRA